MILEHTIIIVLLDELLNINYIVTAVATYQSIAIIYVYTAPTSTCWSVVNVVTVIEYKQACGSQVHNSVEVVT